MNDSLLGRRQALAGGDEGNGFELWRVLVWDHEGCAQQCQIAGVMHFVAFTHTRKDARTLGAHLDEGFRAGNRYGNNMPRSHLREMRINIMPNGIQEDSHDR